MYTEEIGNVPALSDKEMSGAKIKSNLLFVSGTTHFKITCTLVTNCYYTLNFKMHFNSLSIS